MSCTPTSNLQVNLNCYKKFIIPLETNVSFGASGVSITIFDTEHFVIVILILIRLGIAWFMQREGKAGIYRLTL
jgi:hypothetical protein